MVPTPSSSASGELWGHHLMPAEITVDCLLPNGILIPLPSFRDTTLRNLKEDLWREAKRQPLYGNLLPASNYVFVTISNSGDKEELFEESRRLCDLRLFVPVLQLIEPVGNRAEKQLAREISFAIGRPLTEFDDTRDVEIIQARLSFLRVAEQAVRDRKKECGADLYCFPSDIFSSREDYENDILNAPDEIQVCVWMNSKERQGEQQGNLGAQKMTIKVSPKLKPTELVREAIYRRMRKLSAGGVNSRQATDCAQDYLLKVAGCQLYLTEAVAIIRYKHIKECIDKNCIPHLMLMWKDDLLKSTDQNWEILQPSFVRRQSSAVRSDFDAEDKQTLWEVDSFFCVKVNSASYINITDVDEIYVKVGMYHGPEQLAEEETAHVAPSNPRWSQVLEFTQMYIPDIPHAAQICFVVCCAKQRKQKMEHWPLAWANLRLLDYQDRFLDSQVSLHMWPFPKGFDGFFNPLGHNGSNPNRDTPRLEIEFKPMDFLVVYPPPSQIKDYVTRFVKVWKTKQNPEKAPLDPSKISQMDKETFNGIIVRDPLHELLEGEKETMWKLRAYCKLVPDSLPRLLDAVKWSSRDEVAEVYVLLESWNTVAPNTALELLDIKYPDPAVRTFAVRCLDKTLTDNQLLLYLMSLVQVLKYEAFHESELAKFLLKRSLLNQRIGHLFFWLMRAELAQNPTFAPFALMLEAFCRGCGPYLHSLLKQVESTEKLENTSNLIKEAKEEPAKVLQEELKHNLNCFQDLESPLDNAIVLGSLQLEECRVFDSAKKPLWLVWRNPDPLAGLLSESHEIIFKNGDDLRQDMLTLQVLRIMDNIWKREGLDFHLIPYRCLPMGKQIGMIEVVKRSQTIFEIQRQSRIGAFNIGSSFLNKWILEHNRPEEQYNAAVERFKLSCAGYCVATFVLGIRDRHQDNIMVTEDGRIFHIDFGHFLGHYKRKFGINRERVPFVLTDLFITVIAKGAENPKKSKEFDEFQRLCGKAYMIMHRHARLFITLFTMMLCMGIPELQKLDDIIYLRKTLGTDLSEEAALQYFQEQFKEAYQGAWTTKTDWLAHAFKHV